MKSVWYISKYLATPRDGSTGGRGFMLMRELAKNGVATAVVTSDSNALFQVPELAKDFLLEEVEGVRVLWLRTFKYRVAKSWRRLWSWCDFEYRVLRAPLHLLPPPDVIVVSSLSLLTVLSGILLRRRHGARLVFEVRDIWPLTLVEEGGVSRLNPLVMLLAFIEKTGYLSSDAIVGTMPNLGEHVKKVLGRSKVVHCIPMGIDEAAYSDPAQLPSDYVSKYFPPGKFVVAHVGTIGITNALETFVACARSLRHHPSIYFLMVGDGDLREKFISECSDLPNIGFAPKVPKNAVQSVLAQCDLVYFSTYQSEVWRYGQSLNKVIDYMYSGKPVVASYSGYPSMINEANCGTFVPAGDVKALADEILSYSAMTPSQRSEIGGRGRSWLLGNRSFDRLARQYQDILFPVNFSAAEAEREVG